VVDVLSGAVAVLALVGVPQEDRPSVERNPTGIRDLDELAEADH